MKTFVLRARWSRQGEVLIADTAEDLNLQPYVLRMLPMPDGEWKLYQWFGLQPYGRDKCGLAISFLVPADGAGPVPPSQDQRHNGEQDDDDHDDDHDQPGVHNGSLLMGCFP